jgi:hypothetical protein
MKKGQAPIVVPARGVLPKSRVPSASHKRRSPGYILIEYLIYIAVLAVVMEVAFSAFYRYLDHSRDLNRASDDILRVLRVGELWRADIRQAVGPPRVIEEGGLSACEIPHTNTLVVYLAGRGFVWRKQGEGAPREVLQRVKTARIIKDTGRTLTSWRWEIELATRKKVVRVKPLFTFEAVPAPSL